MQNVLNFTMLLSFNFRSTSDRSGKDCCGQWFVGPPLRILVVLMALGGIACTLGGATMGATALAGSPTSHLTAGLLMTGKILFQFIINFYGFFCFQKKEQKQQNHCVLKKEKKTLQTQHEDGNSIQSLLKIYKRKSLQRKLLNFLFYP